VYGELRKRVLAANLALVDAGLVILTFGNASAADREAGVMAIKPSGVPYDALRPDDVPVVDLASGEVVSGTRRASSDTPTHLALYRAFGGVGGVVHTHSPYATAWAQAQRELPCLGTTHADHFHGPVPVTRHLSAVEIAADYEERTGGVILETFAERGLDPLEVPAALVVSHGPFAWGVDVEHAVENAIALEAVAASAYRSVVLAGGLEAIPGELLEKHFSRKHGATASYGQPM
jgi:L-ribulose-5-phosphate 4-epimerase